MKFRLSLILAAAFVMILVTPAPAQESNFAAQTLQNLNAQLRDIQDQEAELKIRLEQLEFDLKPENIERYFNGVGSTRPEELRKSRRDQLQIEKNRVLAKLNQLAASRADLQTSIANAQAQAYQQSALGLSTISLDSPRGSSFWWMLMGIAVILLVLGSLVMRIIIRERQHY
jgi:uncharacterized protein YlxW (UPF0749 family)